MYHPKSKIQSVAPHFARISFSSITAITRTCVGTREKYCSWSSSSALSSSTSSSSSTAATAAATNTNTNQNSSSHSGGSNRNSSTLFDEEKYVMVRRNKQSMAFRNGSPLVFSGSIQSTFHFLSWKQHLLPTTRTTTPPNLGIPIGSLVGVMVAGKETSQEEEAKKNGKQDKGRSESKKKYTTKKDENTHSITHFQVDTTMTTTTTWNERIGTSQKDEAIHQSKMTMEQFDSILSHSNLIGFGVYNPRSMYRVRILCHQSSHPTLFRSILRFFKKDAKNPNELNDDTFDGMNTSHLKDEKESIIMEMILQAKVREAILVRTALDLPSFETDSYRLLNGEGDGLSGLAVDIFGRFAVVMSSAAWCELYKPVITKVLHQALNENHPVYSSGIHPNQQEAKQMIDIIWRNTPSRLLQDGLDIRKEIVDKIDSDEGENDKGIIVTENAVRYYTYPLDLTSQKTGFYCDQRENRFNLAKLCKGKRVLDLCCYNGGFALNAILRGEAKKATGVDSSPVAIDAAMKNAELNGLKDDQISFVREDIAQFMKNAAANGDEYDVIILDPPKLAPTAGDLERASRKYHALNRDAIKLISKRNGGILMSCTCSGAMTQKDGGQFFLQTIKEASLAAGRQITLLSTSGAAKCHTQCPASYPAGAYLTASLFSVLPLNL